MEYLYQERAMWGQNALRKLHCKFRQVQRTVEACHTFAEEASADVRLARGRDSELASPTAISDPSRETPTIATSRSRSRARTGSPSSGCSSSPSR